MAPRSFASDYRLNRSHMAKLYEMVNDPSSDSVISWSESGTSFIVWNPQEFGRDVLPKFFSFSDYFAMFTKSFLDDYGFKKIHPDRWEYAEEDFVRGQRERISNLYARVRAREEESEEGKELQKLIAERMAERRTTMRFEKVTKEIGKKKITKKEMKNRGKKAANELGDELQHVQIRK